MKKLLAMYTMVGLMVVSAFAGTYSADNNTEDPVDYGLTLKAYVVDAPSVDVVVYTLESNKWVEDISYTCKKTAVIQLNPESEYMIYFTSKDNTKILHIPKGIKGKWYRDMDLDFSNDTHYAVLRFNPKSKEYVLAPVDESYVLCVEEDGYPEMENPGLIFDPGDN